MKKMIAAAMGMSPERWFCWAGDSRHRGASRRSFFFRTMWRGEANGLLEGWMIPRRCISTKAFLAIFSFSGLSCRGELKTGCPVVSIQWVVLCCALMLKSTSPNIERKLSTSFWSCASGTVETSRETSQTEKSRVAARCCVFEVNPVELSLRLRFLQLTLMSLLARKSIPRMFCCTLAAINLNL